MHHVARRSATGSRRSATGYALQPVRELNPPDLFERQGTSPEVKRAERSRAVRNRTRAAGVLEAPRRSHRLRLCVSASFRAGSVSDGPVQAVAHASGSERESSTGGSRTHTRHQGLSLAALPVCVLCHKKFRGNESNVRPLGSEPSVATSSNHPGVRLIVSRIDKPVGSVGLEPTPQGLKDLYAAVTPRPHERKGPAFESNGSHDNLQ